MKSETLIERLKVFFPALAFAKPTNDTFIERLSEFFEQQRNLCLTFSRSVSDVSVKAANEIGAETLTEFFNALSAPLQTMLSKKDFLNVWSVAGLKRNEVRNAAVFASLIDPKICPRTGSELLCAFLNRVGQGNEHISKTVREIEKGYSVNTENYPLGNVDNRVDLSVEGSGFLLLIELKIDATEGVMQLQRYSEILQAKATLLNKHPLLVYLSSQPPKNPPIRTIHARWTDVAAAAKQIARQHETDDLSFVSRLLVDFATHVGAFA